MGELTIVWATYGPLDVVDRVRELANRGWLYLVRGTNWNDLFGDPTPMKNKTLKIGYTWFGVEMERWFSERTRQTILIGWPQEPISPEPLPIQLWRYNQKLFGQVGLQINEHHPLYDFFEVWTKLRSLDQLTLPGPRYRQGKQIGQYLSLPPTLPSAHYSLILLPQIGLVPWEQLDQWLKPGGAIFLLLSSPQELSMVDSRFKILDLDLLSMGWICLLEKPKPPPTPPVDPKVLVLYAHCPCKVEPVFNLEFFARHGMERQANVTYKLIVNGPSTPAQVGEKWSAIHYRVNQDHDFGAWTHGLEVSKGEKEEKYDYYIFLNDTVRGPFYHGRPENQDWIPLYLARITEEVKLVGPSINIKIFPHVQSCLFATDRVGLAIIQPVMQPQPNRDRLAIVMQQEVGMSRQIIQAGYNLDCFLDPFRLEYRYTPTTANDDHDVWYATTYYGGAVDALETIFVKSSRLPGHRPWIQLTQLQDPHLSLSTEFLTFPTDIREH